MTPDLQQGVDLKAEVLDLVEELPGTFRTMVSMLCEEDVGEAIELYEQFLEYAHPSAATTVAAKAEEKGEGVSA